MYFVSFKCLIFTFIIDFYLFFGQSTDGKELLHHRIHKKKLFSKIFKLTPRAI
jgi:hypothetical protein